MLKKIKSFYIAPLAVLAVFALVFATNGFYPFGSASVSWCDMNQQVIPLFCNFKDILSGNSGFLLNLNNAGGMNFLGVFFFFLSSPFTFLVAFFEKADIPFLMNILVVLKLCACAATAGIYFESTFKKQSTAFKTILCFAYAFSGYGMMFYQNIIWLDLMYLFPLLLLGTNHLLERDKPALLTLCLSLCTAVNFYLSYCVYLFIIILLGIYTLSKSVKDKTAYLKLGISAICSLLITAAVCLPSLIQYFSSGRTSNVIEGLKNCSFFTYTETTLAAVLSSGIIFAVLLIILPRFFEQNKKTTCLIAAFLTLLIPMFVEPVNRMWHTGSYMSFPVRFGFIAVFIGLAICGEYFEKQDLEHKTTPLFGALSIFLCLVLGGFMLYYVNQNTDTLTNYVQTLWGDKDSLRGLLVIFGVAVMGYLVPLVFARKKLIGKNILAVCLSLVVLCESLCATTIYIAPAKDKLNTENYQNFVALEDDITDEGFFRVNLSHKFIDANMTGAIGYNSLGHYTSFTDKNYMTAVKHLGYSGYWMEIGNWGGNTLSDALMSVKYTVNKNGDTFSIFENDLVLSPATLVSAVPEAFESGNRIEVLGDAFAQMFSLEKSPVTAYEMSGFSDCNYYNNFGTHIFENWNGGIITYTVNVSNKQRLYFDCFGVASNALVEPINNSFSVFVNGNAVAYSYPEQNYNGTLYLGEFENETVEIRLQLKKGLSCKSFGVFGIDVNAVEDALANAQTFDLSIEQNKITGEIPKSQSGTLFLSLPYNEGYKITVNGQEVPYRKALTGFTAVNLENGGTLKITFMPKGLPIGLALSGIGALLTALFLLKHKKLNLLPEGIKKAVYALFITVFVAAITIVYAVPILINLV